MCTILYGNARRKANGYAFENGMTNPFLRESSWVNSVVMNYKIKHNKNQPATRPARYSLAFLTTYSVIVCGGRKTEKHGMDMRGYVKG